MTTDDKTRVGDILKHTIVVKNEAVFNSLWKNVVVTDTLLSGVVLNTNSITIDGNGTGTDADFSGGIITVRLGDIANGVSKTIAFEVEVAGSAAGITITNTAAKVLDKEATDEALR